MTLSNRRLTVLLALAGSCLGCQAAAGDGIRATIDDVQWSRWQARLVVGNSFSLWRHAVSENAGLASQPDTLGLFGDYYFARLPLGERLAGGFRATSGLLVGRPGNLGPAAFGAEHAATSILGAAPGGLYETSAYAPAETVPYLGLGYTGGLAKSGWGFRADIGLMAQGARPAARFGRAPGGSPTLDDVLREMRLSPLLNIGVSYSF